MSDLTSRVAELSRQSAERRAIWNWLSRRRRALRSGGMLPDRGSFVDGYAAALDDVEILLLARDQHA